MSEQIKNVTPEVVEFIRESLNRNVSDPLGYGTMQELELKFYSDPDFAGEDEETVYGAACWCVEAVREHDERRA